MKRLVGFTLIELIISVALLIVAISIALFAVVGTNGMIQKADARSSISESTRGVGNEIRRALNNAPVGSVSLLPDPINAAAIRVKSFSDLQSGNTCTVIGRANASTDSGGEEKYTITTTGTVIAVLIYNVDSGGRCPELSTDPIYQNRLTNAQAVVKDAQLSLQNISCASTATGYGTTCITKQLLRYSLTLEMAQKGSGGTSEARRPTLTVQEGLSIGLVNEATTVLKIDTVSLPDANARGQYSAGVAASGGMPPYKLWSITNGSWSGQPPGGQGFSINPNTGVITVGTLNPQAAGQTYSFTVSVTDSDNPPSTTSKPLSIKVLDNQITITTTQADFDSHPARETSVYSQQLTATMKLNPSNCGNSCVWSIPPNSLPSGLTLDTNNGRILGKPDNGTAPNSPYSLAITATENGNPTNFETKTFSLVVESDSQSLAITTTSLPGGTAGTSYSQAVTAAGGTGSYTWSLFSGTLPPGLALTSGTPSGTISGVPTTAGTYNFVLKVVDGGGNNDTQALIIIIGADTGGSE